MDNNYMKTILSGIKEWTRSLIQAAADNAQRTADTAQRTADNAQRTADTAQRTADTAQRTADTAQRTADTAQVAADTAQVAADTAQVAADTAQRTADTAQRTADNAFHPQILYDDRILIWDGTTTTTESTVQVKYFTNVSELDSTKKTRYYRISNISDNVVKYALAHYEDIKCATKVQNGTENELELIDNWYVDSSGLCVSCEDYYIIIVGESGSHVARFPGVTVPFRIDFPQAGIYIGYCTDSSVEGDAGKSFTHKIALPTYGLPLDSVVLTTDSDKNIQVVDTETGTKKTLKSAYSYAQEGGYTGTEAEFAAKLAAEKLPNPYPLTFTGAVNETYDGSSAKTITIPSGGGASGLCIYDNYDVALISFAQIDQATLPIDAGIVITEDDNGNPFSYDGVVVWTDIKSGASYTDIDFNNVSNVHYPIQHGVKDSMNMYVVDGTSMRAIVGYKSCVYIRQTRDDVNKAFYPAPNIAQLPEKITAIHLCPRNKVTTGTFYKIWGLTKK